MLPYSFVLACSHREFAKITYFAHRLSRRLIATNVAHRGRDNARKNTHVHPLSTPPCARADTCRDLRFSSFSQAILRDVHYASVQNVSPSLLSPFSFLLASSIFDSVLARHPLLAATPSLFSKVTATRFHGKSANV